MKNRTFNRGLRQQFVDSLNALYAQPGSWWKPLVDDKETFIGIRENSVNVYFRGASLLRLRPSGDRGVAAEVHYKYLVKPRLENVRDEYVSVGHGGRIDAAQLTGMISDRVEVGALKAAAKNYADDEKTGVHVVATEPQNAVVDLEVAISDGSVARRIDMAALVDLGDSIALRFFEAKAFTNQELRASESKIPRVIGQIEAYAGLLKEHRDEVEGSYRRVCENLRALDGVDLSGRRGALINEVADNRSLEVDTTPGLVVFGFDRDQRDGKVWCRHRKRLEAILATKPIARGRPEDVRLDKAPDPAPQA